MSEYQYYEFLAIDRPLTAAEQAEVRQLSTRARITATSFTNEYHWGDFRGDPHLMMRRYYDAHLYLANWGTHQIMLRLPRTLLSPEIAEQYGVDGHVGVTATPESVILDLISEDDSGEWVEDAEDSLSAIVGVRSELAAGDLRALYLAWLSAYRGREWDEDAFGEDDEDEREPPVPAELGSLTAPRPLTARDRDIQEQMSFSEVRLADNRRHSGRQPFLLLNLSLLGLVRHLADAERTWFRRYPRRPAAAGGVCAGGPARRSVRKSETRGAEDDYARPHQGTGPSPQGGRGGGAG